MYRQYGAVALALCIPLSAGAETLSAAGLSERLSGQTYEVRRLAIRMALTFDPDGTVRAEGPLGEMAGSWTITGDELCMDLPRMGPRCDLVTAEADGALLFGDGQRLTPK